MNRTCIEHALCSELKPQGEHAPDWMQLIPRGPDVRGRDGRAFRLSSVKRVLDAFASNKMQLPIDWEHSTELLAPQGMQSPAAGWVTDVEERDGEVWGKVEWTDRGRNSVTSREYRYISPVFSVDRKTREIQALLSVALTNRPNLFVQALNHQGETKMDERLIDALGVDADASIDDAVARIKELRADKEANATQRERADAAALRALELENELNALRASIANAEIDALVDGAIKSGKVTPASREMFIALCQTEDGREHFKKHIASAKVVAPDVELHRVDAKKHISDETAKIAQRLGLDPQRFVDGGAQ